MLQIDRLTRAEKEIRELVERGYSNKDIAAARGRKLRTVEGQVSTVLSKLDCTRLELVANSAQSRLDPANSRNEQTNLDRLTPEFVEQLLRGRAESRSPESPAAYQQNELIAVIESTINRAFAQNVGDSRQRLAILGLGKTAVAVASAAKASGGDPILVDPRVRPALEAGTMHLDPFIENAASELHVPLLTDWSGSIRHLAPEQIVVSPGIDSRHPLLKQAIKDGLPVISEIEYAYRISKAPIIAIGGTNGKTTTAVMTYLMLRAAGLDAILCGRVYGTEYDEIPLVEAARKATSSQILVAEISCYDLEFVREFRPKVAAITSITPDHLDRYGTYEAYLKTERRLFRRMKLGDTVVCNVEAVETAPGPRKGLDVLKWSSTGGDTGAHAFMSEDAITVCGHSFAKQDFPFSYPFLFENALCASLVALAAGANPEDLHWISDGLSQFGGIAHRMEIVGIRAGVRFINNSICANPSALQSVVDSATGPLRLLVGGISNGMVFDEVLKAALDAHSVYLYGADARTINLALGGRWPVFELMEDALGAATADAASGDTIILSPAAGSMDQFKDFRDRGDRFRELVKHHLER